MSASNGSEALPEATTGRAIARPPAAVSYRVGARLIPWKGEPRCIVCNSDYRGVIERSELQGKARRTVIDGLPLDADVRRGRTTKAAADLVGEHFRRGHGALDATVMRIAAERQAERMGVDLDAAEGSIVDHISLLEAVVVKTYESIADGFIKPTVGDGVRAAKTLAALDMFGDSGVDMELMVAAFKRYMEITQSVMTPDQFSQFGQQLSTDPELAKMVGRANRQGAIETTTSAEQSVDA